MKYLCLCYYDAEKEAQLSQEELEAIGPACNLNLAPTNGNVPGTQ